MRTQLIKHYSLVLGYLISGTWQQQPPSIPPPSGVTPGHSLPGDVNNNPSPPPPHSNYERPGLEDEIKVDNGGHSPPTEIPNPDLSDNNNQHQPPNDPPPPAAQPPPEANPPPPPAVAQPPPEANNPPPAPAQPPPEANPQGLPSHQNPSNDQESNPGETNFDNQPPEGSYDHPPNDPTPVDNTNNELEASNLENESIPDNRDNYQRPHKEESNYESPDRPGYDINSPDFKDDVSKKFSGVSYSMLTKNDCKSPHQTKDDIVLLSKFTNNIRLYGNDCNQLKIILDIINHNNLDLKLLAGIWTRDGPERRDEETKATIDVIKRGNNRQHVTGITVGNEEKFNSRSEDAIIEDINHVRHSLNSQGIHLPVGTVEVGHEWTKKLADHSDIIFANLYSFFADNPNPHPPMKEAAKAVIDQALSLQDKLQNSNKKLIISETGWPSGGTVDGPHYGTPSVFSQSQFLAYLTCYSRSLRIPYYAMEAFDANWKDGAGIERNFGIFTPRHTLKSQSYQVPTQC